MFRLDGELRALLRTVLVVAGTLLLGSLILVLVALALEVSRRVGFGIWGAVAVVAGAAAIGALWWRRSARAAGGSTEPRGRPATTGGHRTPGAGAKPAPGASVVRLPGRLAAALDTPPAGPPATAPAGPAATDRPRPVAADPPPAPARAPDEPTATPGDDGLRGRYYDALRAGHLDEAAALIAQARQAGEDPRWCDNADRRIAHQRRRAES